MHFRGCTFRPLIANGPISSVWYEAHEINKNNYVVVQIMADPDNVRRPSWVGTEIKKHFRFVERNSLQRARLPGKAINCGNFATANMALNYILNAEDGMCRTQEMRDMGDRPIRGIKHYTELMDCRKLDVVPAPEKLYDAADKLLDDITTIFKLGRGVSQRRMAAAERASIQYAEMLLESDCAAATCG
jgi:hypothetical protein